MQNMKNLLTFCLMVCCVAVQAQLVTYPEGLQTGMSHNDGLYGSCPCAGGRLERSV